MVWLYNTCSRCVCGKSSTISYHPFNFLILSEFIPFQYGAAGVFVKFLFFVSSVDIFSLPSLHLFVPLISSFLVPFTFSLSVVFTSSLWFHSFFLSSLSSKKKITFTSSPYEENTFLSSFLLSLIFFYSFNIVFHDFYEQGGIHLHRPVYLPKIDS